MVGTDGVRCGMVEIRDTAQRELHVREPSPSRGRVDDRADWTCGRGRCWVAWHAGLVFVPCRNVGVCVATVMMTNGIVCAEGRRYRSQSSIRRQD